MLSCWYFPEYSRNVLYSQLTQIFTLGIKCTKGTFRSYNHARIGRSTTKSLNESEVIVLLTYMVKYALHLSVVLCF